MRRTHPLSLALRISATSIGLMAALALENLATERLAERRIYEFLFTVMHARTRGSTAAVVAPAAVY